MLKSIAGEHASSFIVDNQETVEVGYGTNPKNYAVLVRLKPESL